MTDHDSRVIALRQVSARAWELGELLDWALVKAKAAGFGSVTVARANLAETGDPNRFATPGSLDWHAGLCPRDNASGGYQGKTSISGRGRPALRVAAWRAVWAALPDNPVMAAKFIHLTTRDDNQLARQQARTARAAALLRWIHLVITRQVRWDPAIAAGIRTCQAAGWASSARWSIASRSDVPRSAASPASTQPRIRVPAGTFACAAIRSTSAKSSAGSRTDCTTDRPRRSPCTPSGSGWSRRPDPQSLGQPALSS